MFKDQKVNSIKFHKGVLRKIIRDERFNPDKKLLAELLLSHMEETLPRPLLESIILELYGQPNRVKQGTINTVEDAVDKQLSESLKEEWREMIGENKPDGNSN
jgi:hypothetical protein